MDGFCMFAARCRESWIPPGVLAMLIFDSVGVVAVTLSAEVWRYVSQALDAVAIVAGRTSGGVGRSAACWA